MAMTENDISLDNLESTQEQSAFVTACVLATIGFATYGGYKAGQLAAEKVLAWKQNHDRKKNLKVVSDN